MANESFHVYLDQPTFKGALTLKRIPKFLRFTCVVKDRKHVWDALDQLDDVAMPDEHIVAAVLIEKGNLHIDKTVDGRRVGEWITTARYRVIDDGPPDAVLRSNEAWREWCVRRNEDELARKSSP